MKTILIVVLSFLLISCTRYSLKTCQEGPLSYGGKEITYHYADKNNKTEEFEYIFYIHVDKNGNIKFVPKQNRKFNNAQKVLELSKKEVFIERSNYAHAQTRGLIFENIERTYFKKGDCGYQDALEYYFIDAFGYPFLIEIDGETKNLAPILQKNREMINKNAIPALYNEKGENISSIYWHGVSEETLPTTSNSTGQTHAPQCKQTQ